MNFYIPPQFPQTNLKMPPNPKYSIGYSPLTERQKLLNFLNTTNLPIKSVIQEDLNRANNFNNINNLIPVEQNYDGVQFFMFNEPSPEYNEEFRELMYEYSKYYQPINKSNICCGNLAGNGTKPLSKNQISCIDYKTRRVRNYDRELSLDQDDLMIDFFTKRVKMFEKCKRDLTIDHIQNNFENTSYFNYNKNINSLNIEPKYKIFEKYKKFLNDQKKKKNKY